MPRVAIQCPHCRRDLLVREGNLGRSGLCRYCGHQFRALPENHAAARWHSGTHSFESHNVEDLLALRVSALELELEQTMAELASQAGQQRAAADDVREVRAQWSEAALREAAATAEAEGRRAQVDSLHADLRRQREDADRVIGELNERLIDVQRSWDETAADLRMAERRASEREARADAECNALAKEVARLEDGLHALEDDHRRARVDHQSAVEVERFARQDDMIARQRLTMARDAFKQKTRWLHERLKALENARDQIEAQRRDDRDRWDAQRQELQEQWHREREDLLAESSRRAESSRGEEREHGDAERHAAEVRRENDERTWRANTERLLSVQRKRFEDALRAFHAELDAVRRSADEHEALQREAESLRKECEEEHRARELAQVALETGRQAENGAARLVAAIERGRRERSARDREHEITLASLKHEMEEVLRERDEMRQRLRELGRERDSLDAALSAAQGALERGQSVAIAELERLRRLVLDVAAERNTAFGELEEARRAHAQLLPPEPAHVAQNAGESTRGTGMRLPMVVPQLVLVSPATNPRAGLEEPAIVAYDIALTAWEEEHELVLPLGEEEPG